MTYTNEPADQGDLWDRWADTFDDWNAGKDPDEAVDFLRKLAPAGRFLELGVGTGRVALALAKTGVDVEGIEISPQMAAQLEAKRGDLPVKVTIGDMADVPVDGEFDVVYVIFSSFFHLTEQDRQLRCFENVAKVLKPGGSFVLECFIPWPGLLSPSKNLVLHDIDDRSARVQAAMTDLATQRITFQELTFSNEGVRALPVVERYCWPSELDLMAKLAGMNLSERHSSFTRIPFTRKTLHHVSVYRTG